MQTVKEPEVGLQIRDVLIKPRIGQETLVLLCSHEVCLYPLSEGSLALNVSDYSAFIHSVSFCLLSFI